MTNNKLGSVNQQPLYGCTGCFEIQTFYACDLRVHDRECWCDRCWDEYKEAELGIEYADLPAFEPGVSTLVESLEGLMRVEARDRIMPVGTEWDAARAALAAYHKQGGNND